MFVEQNSEQQPGSEAAPSTSGGQDKIQVLFRNTGSAPVLKRSKWNISPTSTVADTITFMRRYLKSALDKDTSIFIYVNQSFAPPLDQTIQNLFDCYESDKKLVLYYSLVQAWG